jgi:acyl-CoA thioesterase-2
VTALASLLELEQLGRDRFRSSHAPDASSKLSLYGGLVVAQALRAAGTTVTPDRLPHSLHAYFLRPGRVDQPVELEVERHRDGKAFAARHVRAVQDGKVIVSVNASFCAPATEVCHDAVPARAADPPDALSGRSSPLLVEIREITPTRVGDGAIRHTDRLWVRAEPLPDDPLVHACAVAYVSDLGCGFGQAEIPGVGVDGANLGHSVWFQAPMRADAWMLLELWPLAVAGTRGTYQGSLRDASGALGAVVTQEMLLRDRPLPPEVVTRMAEYLGLEPPVGAPPD